MFLLSFRSSSHQPGQQHVVRPNQNGDERPQPPNGGSPSPLAQPPPPSILSSHQQPGNDQPAGGRAPPPHAQAAQLPRLREELLLGQRPADPRAHAHRGEALRLLRLRPGLHHQGQPEGSPPPRLPGGGRPAGADDSMVAFTHDALPSPEFSS